MSLPMLPAIAFRDPFLLILLVLPLLLLWLERRHGKRWQVSVPVVVPHPGARSLRSQLRGALPLLRALGLSALIVAMARPIGDRNRSPVEGQGIDIALLVDVSTSMNSEDMAHGESRLAVVKGVLRPFVTARDGDRMGIIAFARYPVTLCPFTLDSETVAKFVDKLEPVSLPAEDGTAIGVALAQAARRLKKSNATSRVVVLLTDGANNVDDITPEEGAKLAAALGIRVYTILAGRESIGSQRFPEDGINPKPLIDIARATGGEFFRAEDANALAAIYRQINRLEKSKFTEARFENFRDLFWAFASQGIFFLFGASVLEHTWLRRLP